MDHGQGQHATRREAGQAGRTLQPGRAEPRQVLVAVAGGLFAVCYLGLVVVAPALLLAAVPVIMVAACGLSARLRSRRVVLWGIGLWLAVGISGAWWWRAEPVTGLVWVVASLFLLPLPLIPWLFAATFEDRS